MPDSPSRRRGSVVQDQISADDPRLGVARPSRLAFGHAAKLRRPDLAIIDRIGDPSGAPHDVSRAISERSGLAARVSGGSGGAGVVARAGAAEKQEPGGHRQDDQTNGPHDLPRRARGERLLFGCDLGVSRGGGLALKSGHGLAQGVVVAAHRFISRCERIPDSWSYIATLGFVLAFIVTADNLGELRAQSRAPEIAAAMAAEGVAEIGRRSDAYSYLSPCPQQTVIDVMGAQSFAIEPGPGGRPLVTIDRPVAAPCAYAGMVIDRRAQQ